jgi:hypothetical protein
MNTGFQLWIVRKHLRRVGFIENKKENYVENYHDHRILFRLRP